MVLKFPKVGVPLISTSEQFCEAASDNGYELTAKLQLSAAARAGIIALRLRSPCYWIPAFRAGSAPVGPSLVEAYVWDSWKERSPCHTAVLVRLFFQAEVCLDLLEDLLWSRNQAELSPNQTGVVWGASARESVR